MANPGADLEEKLRALRATYLTQLPEKLRQIDEVWDKLQADWNSESLHTLHRMVHSLTGSGTTFGMPEISEAARPLEQTLKQLVNSNATMNAETHEDVSDKIDQLRRVALKEDSTASPEPQTSVAMMTNVKHVASKKVLVVENEHALAQELALQLGYFGYQVQICTQLENFRQILGQSTDTIVLSDISFYADSLGGVKAVKAVQQVRATPFPVMFISSNNDIISRLEATRAGGLAYFLKPVNMGELIDKLDSLTSSQPEEIFRVLIVDDSESLSSYHATVLEQAGMVARVINNPMEIMTPLLEFSPDLILMDVYMPECNGLELAKVIRQLEAFVSTPIVYLSAEKDLDKQFSAMSLGGDDFLVKPIQAQHLISSLRNRIERSRLLKSFMVRDSLTGLLNHTAIKDQLDREVARAERMRTPLSFAMIDIDFFKRVNDTYGHPTGDRVIKSLARLLKQRLRETDVIGRYGGEEFAVIMSGTDGHTAMNVLNEIRQVFSQLHHLSGVVEFLVSFSCGIAEFANFEDANKIAEAADKAMYEAKNAGRNQLALARK
jgi:diguanylate cyclase (GGDEF)-like protein